MSQGRGKVHPAEDKDLGLWGGKGQTAIGWELLRELENCAVLSRTTRDTVRNILSFFFHLSPQNRKF